MKNLILTLSVVWLAGCSDAVRQTSTATAPPSAIEAPASDGDELRSLLLAKDNAGGGGGGQTCTASGATCTYGGSPVTVPGCTSQPCGAGRTPKCLDAFCGTVAAFKAICTCGSAGGGGGPFIASH